VVVVGAASLPFPCVIIRRLHGTVAIIAYGAPQAGRSGLAASFDCSAFGMETLLYSGVRLLK